METLQRALKEWTQELGKENVTTGTEKLEVAQTTTFRTTQRILVILAPSNVDEVQSCLRIANKYTIPIYPTSGGKNWGYGGRVPVGETAALLSLHRLNRILEYDEKLAFVTVEAGVTQQKLLDFLKKNKINLWMDPTTSSPEASLVGNYLERGHGMTPYGDHVKFACGLEVVLPTGELIQTGYCRFANARTAHLDNMGVGPSLDGLFVQSNFGIVTKMSLWLMPPPDCVRAAFFVLNDQIDIIKVVDAVQPLRLDGTLRSGPHFRNLYHSLARNISYPWKLVKESEALPWDIARKLGKDVGLGAWNGFLGLYGTKQQVDEQQRLLEIALTGKVAELVITGPNLEGLPGPWREKRLSYVMNVLSLLSGHLGYQATPDLYWRKQNKSNYKDKDDPERDGCGVIWCLPLVPFRGNDVYKVSKMAEKIIMSHGFEPHIAFVSLRERVLHFHIRIVYDRNISGADIAAMKAHDNLLAQLVNEGYFPSRLGIHSMSILNKESASYRQLLENIKKMIDPNNILARGRYHT